jgi:hypothetical protein
MPPGQRLTTMNARAETVGQLRSYKSARAKSQLCLVPMRHFFEPNWEQEKHVRWSIGTDDLALVHAVDHQCRQASFHEALLPSGEKKRSLVIVPSADYDD